MTQRNDQQVTIEPNLYAIPPVPDRAHPIVVVVMVAPDVAPFPKAAAGPAYDRLDDEEPTWEDAEWC